MCDHCGCSLPAGRKPAHHHHGHDHGHPHGHSQAHDHAHDAEHRTIELHQSLMARNDRLAEQNRGYFRAKGLAVLNLVSSPGSGKTAILERTLHDLGGELKMATIVGDLATDHDARRLRKSGAPSVQITTGTVCHLDAHMVQHALEDLDLAGAQVLFIENVGNLVCPAGFDLGEDKRIVVTSVTEGEDKPLKYPSIFQNADLVLLNKCDLSAAVDFNRGLALENLRAAAPGAVILEVSARTGAGMAAWYDTLRAWAKDKAPAARPRS